MKAIHLRTEYLNDPLGIDIIQPRLFWNAEGGKKQTAYQIVTGEYDSGKVSSSSMRALWQGKAESSKRVTWKIRLWDENDQAGEWSQAFFEFGLLAKEDWKAKWISGDYHPKHTERYPVDCFKRSITVKGKVKEARLYATACGLYEARIDGIRTGDFVLAPGYTDYRRRVQYQTYDVTSLLQEGNHEITAELGDGWYRGSCGAWGRTCQYGRQTKLLMQLKITYEDGSDEIIGTDESWKWSNDGPIRFADNKDGEVVEAWRRPGYAGQARLTSHRVTPSASNNVAVREHETFHPIITVSANGRKLLNFRQNKAGYVRFTVDAHQGQKMIWRFGEMVDEEGNLTLKNIQLSNKKKTTPLQQIVYECAEGKQTYSTTFAVFGFQYAEVETDVELNAEEIEAVAVYSDLEQTGWFTSSSELLNRFYDATVWSAKSNHLDIPTDCPTRERHGWTGDAQVFFTSASYLFAFAPFARNYMHDVYDWQRESGRLPHITPDGGADFYMWTMNGSVGWSDAGVLIPYRFAKMYQDDSLIKELYDGMASYARFMENRCGRTMPVWGKHIPLSKKNRRYLVNDGQSYGEWAEPADVTGGFDWKDFAAPHPEVSTAYTSYVLGLMAEVARSLGHEADAAEFEKFSRGCRDAYRELVETDLYPLDTDVQARLVRPLYMNLLDDEKAAFAKKRLLKALENYGYRLGTGFLSTPLILYVLKEYAPEAAYRLLENEEIPGWLSMPKAGATTIWEDWDGPNSKQGGIGSLNHYSKGAVVEWLFSSMCGIRVEGENHFVIQPLPGGHMKEAGASYQSVFGMVKSGWKKDGEQTEYHVTVPCNCTAEIRLPKGRVIQAEAGDYTFMEN